MLIGPVVTPADNAGEVLVEPPGIAPGSSPLIARAFIPIDRTNPNRPNIGPRGREGKDGRPSRQDGRPKGAGCVSQPLRQIMAAESSPG